MVETLELAIRPAALPMIAVAATIVLVGVASVARDQFSAVTGSFLLLIVTASAWLSSTAISIMSVEADASFLWSRITYLFVCAIPSAVLQFALALARGNTLRTSRLELAIAWSHSIAFMVLFAFTDLMLAPPHHYPWGFYTGLRPAAGLFLAFLAVALLRSTLVLLFAWRETPVSQQRSRIGSFVLALIVGYAATIDFLPSFGVAVLPVGYLAVLGFIAMAARAITRYRFVDLTPSFVAAQLLETMSGGVIVVDAHGTIRVANPTAATLLACEENDLVGSNLRDVLRTRTLPATESGTFVRAGAVRNRTMTWMRKDGVQTELSVSATMLRDRGALPVGVLYVLTDLEERRRAESHEFAANHDPLTGLPNRTYLANRFDTIAASIVERHRIPAALFLDLDGFKDVNDRHGHQVGDRVLQLAASRLGNALREEDLVSRYGGDEFVVLVGVGKKEDAAIVAAKLVSVLQEPLSLDGLTLRVGASVGIALAPEHGTDLEQLVRIADAEMYRVKQGRRTASGHPDDPPQAAIPQPPPVSPAGPRA
jgi:diguanylate cyclase (GGDEF)-like protein/PAS domain S-box-containing protein